MDLGQKLAGKRLLITGASSGIGAHLALLAARCGAHVAVAARRRERLEKLVGELREAGAASALAVSLDVSDPASIKACAAKAFQTFDGLDVLVNNAGVSGGGLALDTKLADFDDVMNVNLRGPWQMAVSTARQWRENGEPGIVINTASILGFGVSAGLAPYSVSKAAIIQMTKALALEWARHNIRVNALAPGYFETEINAGYFDTAAGEKMVARIPMRRIGNLPELDGPFMLLATDASSFMTGTVLTVDGGHLVSDL
ncbi:MAG: 2-deoxy-D-gluconate 3-dehydrogenase [Hyphomicrobiales bacterium]|nr:MAG: 2-deoxy-D-gluconate 3-dehydrogenase [Hyphomicrobiales bacterium]